MELLVFFLVFKHGRNYIRKTARQDGSHAAYMHVTGSAFEVHIITLNKTTEYIPTEFK